MQFYRNVGTALLACLAAGATGCGSGPAIPDGAASSAAPFTERAAELGLDFVHFNGMSGEYYFVEPLGAGGALVDYDRDGDLDVYVVQGQTLADRPVAELRDRLFRNTLIESGKLGFEDVTEASGIVSTGYGMGVAAGDYDGDGWVDLYVTNFGANVLYRNQGDGTFLDVTAAAGVGEERWSASAVFVDYDGDSHLDLFVANYVDFRLANPGKCYAETTARDYCGPLSYNALPDRLFRNRGDGTFEDRTAPSGIARAFGAGLGVVCADFDMDRRIDIYVANDDHPNQLWINRGAGIFEDAALFAGCALNAAGETEASMGIDAADFDLDGDDDLFVTHLDGETNTLYLNDGAGIFEDRTFDAGLGIESKDFTGFGTAWIDYDNDGLLDLIVANGAVKRIMALAREGDPYPLHQVNQLFRNVGAGQFEEVTRAAGPAFELSEVSRGVAVGDLDNDGDPDVLILNNSGPARLLINEVGSRRHWIGFRTRTGPGGADALGAVVEVTRADGTILRRNVRAAASYCSSSDPRVLVGLGDDGTVGEVRVRWTDGTSEVWNDLAIDGYRELVRGEGARE